jgi:GntR family transcriptional regulator, transcriptional repressor for pyruvate dehydrogenase complex
VLEAADEGRGGPLGRAREADGLQSRQQFGEQGPDLDPGQRRASVADVFEARALLEPVAARKIAAMPARGRRGIVAELSALIDAEEESINDPEAFALANAEFHERLVLLAGNQTLSILIEMLNEIVTRAVSAVSEVGSVMGSLSTRQRGIRSQRRLVRLIDEGVPVAAEEHWRAHMAVMAKVVPGQESSTVIDLLHHYD